MLELFRQWRSKFDSQLFKANDLTRLSWVSRFNATLVTAKGKYWNKKVEVHPKLRGQMLRSYLRLAINVAEEASAVVSFAWDRANFLAKPAWHAVN